MKCPKDDTEIRNKNNNSTVQIDNTTTLRYRQCEQGHEYMSVEVLMTNGLTISELVKRLPGVGG